MSKILHFDAFSGIAGDMALAALIDAGASEDRVRAGLAGLPLDPFELCIERRVVSSISALDLRVRMLPSDGGKSVHRHRHWSEIQRWISESGLTPGARDRALAIFGRLAEAEAKVHGVDVAEVAFHEVGAVDSIVDIVGVAIAVDDLAPDRITVSTLPVSRGFVQTAHGPMPLPAPATSLLLRGLPTRPSGLDVELVTPTGAAIVSALADQSVEWPEFTPSAVGWGAGDRELPDRPNLLRVLVGDGPSAGLVGDGPSAGLSDAVVELQANIDDMTGEQHAYLVQSLFSAGALDVWLVPIQMKKGRPAVQLAALCDPTKAAELQRLILTESTSLGVRAQRMSRRCLDRTSRTVETEFGTITVKLALDAQGKPLRGAPEYEDCAAAARRAGVPLMQVTQAAEAEVKRTLLTESD